MVAGLVALWTGREPVKPRGRLVLVSSLRSACNGRLEIEVMTRVSDMDKQLFDRDGVALVIHK